MNILYIGPYRQKSLAGLTSLLVLSNLIQNKKFNITARPLYIDNDPINKNIADDIYKVEKSRYDDYDTVIQHTPPGIAQKIEGVSKNIIIPINNQEILSQQIIEKLIGFDSILIDNKSIYNLYKEYYPKIANKLVTYDYDMIVPPIQLGLFDVKPFDLTKKLYFIGDYHKNINNIYNLCHSFIKNVNIANREYSCIFYLFNIDPTTKQNIEKNLSQIYSTYGIQFAISRILIAPIDCTLENIITAHNSGSIFINLHDDNSNSLNYKISQSLNKNILNFEDTDYVYEFTRNNKLSPSGSLGVSCAAIDNKVNKLINSNHIEQYPPFKKQHINNIL